MRPVTIIGVMALLAFALGWRADPVTAQAAWLAAWWFCLSLTLGTLTTTWIHRLTGGQWGERTRPASRWLASRLPWVLLAAVPWLWQWGALYPWAPGGAGSASDAGVHAAMQVARPDFRQVWFQPVFFEARLAAYALLWLLLWQLERRQKLGKGGASAAMMGHALVTSLAAVDLIMSLMPRWYSSAFGLIVLTTQALGSWAMVIWLSAHPISLADTPDNGDDKPPVLRDLGNLLLMFVMTWGYLAFMQYLIIWSENLPAEIIWYLPRVKGVWGAVTLLVVACLLAVPLLALLFRSVKDSPRALRAVAGVVLIGVALDSAWLVLPSVVPHSPNAWWLCPLAVLGLACVVFGPAPVFKTEVPDGRG